MNPEHRRIRSIIEGGEKKEIEMHPVVRVFMFQSISPEKIPPDTDVKTIQFTQMILALKEGKNSGGQLTPPGGGIEPGESPKKAAQREGVEETHLRMTKASFEEMSAEQKYTFPHTGTDGQTEQKGRRVHYFFGRILPEDVPYVLDPEEDKIKRFEYLSLNDYYALRDAGNIERDGKKLPLLDSMQLSPEARGLAGVDTDQESVETLHAELGTYFARIEAIKKIKVLRYLLTGTRSEDTQMKSLDAHSDEFVNQQKPLLTSMLLQIDRLEEKLTAANDATDQKEINELVLDAQYTWEDAITVTDPSVSDIQLALHHSNMEGILTNVAENYNEKSGKGIPSINMIFPFLVGDTPLNFSELRILIGNPQTKKLLEMVQLFGLWDKAQEGDEHADAMLRKKIHGDAVGGEIDIDAVIAYCNKKGYIDIHNQAHGDMISLEVDKFFTTLQEQSRMSFGDRKVLEQANEVVDQPIDVLLELALGTHSSLQKLSAHQQKIVRWEAKTKLLLAMMMAEAQKSVVTVVKNKSSVIEGYEVGLEVQGSEKNDRSILLGGETYNVSIQKPPKELHSVLRKMLARDQTRGERAYEESIQDVKRASYTFHDTDPRMLEMITIETGGRVLKPENGKASSLEERILPSITAPRVVAEFIQAYLENSSDLSDGTIRIIDYKPVQEGGFDSKGPGGGGNIRLAKFKIEHVDSKGTKRYKEIQLFIPHAKKGPLTYAEESAIRETLPNFDFDPSEDQIILPGDYDHALKKKDDTLYGVARLFDTKGLRSVIEMLRPAVIYGEEIRSIFKSRVSTKKIRKGNNGNNGNTDPSITS